MRYLGVKRFVDRLGSTLTHTCVVRGVIYASGEVVKHRSNGDVRIAYFYFQINGIWHFSFVRPVDYDFTVPLGMQETPVHLYLPTDELMPLPWKD